MNDKLTNLIADVLQIKPVQIEDALAMRDTELWDSLKHMELVTRIEQEFGVDLSFDEIVAMQTVGEIRRILQEHGANGAKG